MSNLKFFAHEGHGNYSENFGWDMGLRTHVAETPMLEKYARRYHESCCENSEMTSFHIDYEQEGVYGYVLSNGGSRSTAGVIVAESYEKARELAKEYDSSFERVEGELGPDEIEGEWWPSESEAMPYEETYVQAAISLLNEDFDMED
jgi:hypothetical protein